MFTSSMVASIFGPFLVIVGIWMLFYAKNAVKTTFKAGEGACCGKTNLLIGLAILSQYNHWSQTLEVLITILGWVLVIRGVLLMFLPNVIAKTTMKDIRAVRVCAVIILVWGILLSKIGMVMMA